MKISTNSRSFRVGFIGSILLFALLNVWVYITPPDRFHGGTRIGFPLPIYVEWFTSPVDITNPEASHGEVYFLENIPVNILLTFFSTLGIGLAADVAANVLKRKDDGESRLK